MKTPKSGTRGLYKNHSRSCRRPARDIDCDCGWRGQHDGIDVSLARWAGKAVDPRTKTDARKVLARLIDAIDNHAFDPTGETPAAATGDQTLSAFIDEFQTHHLDANDKRGTGTPAMLGVLKRSKLGGMSLDMLASSPQLIADWLQATAKDRRWVASTTERYYEQLRALFNYGKRLKQGGKARVRVNPMDDVVPPVAKQPELYRRRVLTDSVEAKLFAACDDLDADIRRAQQTRTKLTQPKADAIRRASTGGTLGTVLAKRYGVTPSVVSAIVNGQIWHPQTRTKGAEMRRRLVVAFDGGPRAGEMLKTTTDHVSGMSAPGPNGKTVRGYVITLTPDITKGGATTGDLERIFVSSPRLVRVIDARLLQLKRNPDGQRFIFGTEGGRYQASFDKLWRRLFRMAGLTPGRKLGVVWHTIRHEFISRLADDPNVSDKQRQDLARHKDPKTTALYSHQADAQLFAAVGRIGKR